MKKTILIAAIIIGIGFTACTNQNNPNSQTVGSNLKAKNDMKNLVSIVEIPTTDFARAVSFYKAILDVGIEEVNMGEVQMGVLAGDDKMVSVVLVKGNDYKPSIDGTIVDRIASIVDFTILSIVIVFCNFSSRKHSMVSILSSVFVA
jgi:uncharacterized protein